MTYGRNEQIDATRTSAPNDLPEMEQIIIGLGHETERLTAIVDSIGKRLHPVLGVHPMTMKEMEEEKPPAYTAPMAAAFDQHITIMRAANNILADLLRRLQL